MNRVACVQWTGAEICAAGIPVRSTIDDQGRMPCSVIRGVTGAYGCKRRSIPDVVDELGAGAGEMVVALAAITSGNCPLCRHPMSGEYEMGGVVTAAPCGHVLRTRRDRR